MAVMKKKGKKEVPGISTSSLPDIIFMLLFFFMVATTMREQDLLVEVRLPGATEIQKLEKKSLVSYIYIGQPAKHLRAKFGTSPRMQLNDSFRSPREIGEFVASERDNLSERDRPGMSVTLKADYTTRMGMITDTKQELRKAMSYKIMYGAQKNLGYQ